MEFIEELKLLWATLVGLPAQVWVEALYLFVAVGLLKATGVVKGSGAAAANAIFATAIGGGFAGLADLNGALQVSATAVIGALYYGIWKKWVSDWVAGIVESVKGKLPSKA